MRDSQSLGSEDEQRMEGKEEVVKKNKKVEEEEDEGRRWGVGDKTRRSRAQRAQRGRRPDARRRGVRRERGTSKIETTKVLALQWFSRTLLKKGAD